VAAADAEDGRGGADGEVGEAAQHLGLVVVEVGERAGEDDGVWAELAGGLDCLRQVCDARLGVAHEPRDVRDDVVHGEVRDVPLARDLRLGPLAQLLQGRLGEVALFEQEVVDDEDADRVNPLLDGLEGAEGALGEGEGERLDDVGRLRRGVCGVFFRRLVGSGFCQHLLSSPPPSLVLSL
jgi:hypothetical protein